MFGLFKKKSQKEKLEETYEKLIKESYKLSTVNRKNRVGPILLFPTAGEWNASGRRWVAVRSAFYSHRGRDGPAQ